MGFAEELRMFLKQDEVNWDLVCTRTHRKDC